MTEQSTEKRLALLIEDEFDLRVIMTRTLETMGFRVIAAGTGTEALRLAGATPGLALVVSDFSLPDIRGDLLLAQMRAGSGFASVIWSGNANAAERARDIGAVFIIKTATRRQIEQAIEAALQKVRLPSSDRGLCRGLDRSEGAKP